MTDTLACLPPLQTVRLDLRRLTLNDAEALQRLTSDPAITSVVHILPTPFTISDAERLILGAQDGRDCFIGGWRRDTGDMTAVLGTHLHGEAEIEIGYWVRPSLQGQGFATEAVASVLTALQGAFPDRRVMAECRIENEASWRLLRRLGFHPADEMGRRPGRQRLILPRAAQAVRRTAPDSIIGDCTH